MIKHLGATLLAALTLIAAQVFAQAPPVQEPSSKEGIEAALTGGVPMGRWKEGLLFEGIRPSPWMANVCSSTAIRCATPGRARAPQSALSNLRARWPTGIAACTPWDSP